MHAWAENDPDPSVVKLTEPVSVLKAPTSVSVTVAVQVVALLTVTDVGAHATDVAVDRDVTVSDVVPTLDACIESPP